MSKSNSSKDTSNSLSHLSSGTTYTSEQAFKLLDKGAKKLSDYNVAHQSKQNTNEEESKTEQSSEQSSQDYKSRLDTSEYVNPSSPNDSASTNDFISRMKTSKFTNSNNDTTNTKEQNTNQKTNANQTNGKNEKPDGDSKEKPPQKTLLQKTGSKLFGFSDNQGKVSKMATILGKTGEKLSKGAFVGLRTSKNLDRAIKSEDGGTSHIQKEMARKGLKTANKVIGKPIKKATKKATVGLIKKLGKAIITVVVKAVKLLIALFSALPILIPILACAIVCVLALALIFGSGANQSTITKYENYMIETQREYDRKIDDFTNENPDGVVLGLRGTYGIIDWRSPLSIIQGTEVDISFDVHEEKLLKSFKDAGLYEKHIIEEKTVTETDDFGEEIEKTIKVLHIVNPTYEDYMEWTKNNFSVIQEFMRSKGIFYAPNEFTSTQLDIIDTLYDSEYFFDEFPNVTFQHYVVTRGNNQVEDDFDHPAYTSHNPLTQAGYKGQCTWFAWGRAFKVTGKKMPTGNAQTWLASAKAMGYQTGSRPSHNAIVVIAGGCCGHVAFVEAWDGKNLTISEGNVGNKCSDDSANCSMVEYAKNNAVALTRVKTYSSYQEFVNSVSSTGRTVIGFIYLDEKEE